MVAGLLAASRARPAKVLLPAARLPAAALVDPWAAGIAQLQDMAPLDGFSSGQWRLVQIGCASLFDTHAAEMRRLGWTTEDAFGVHPDAHDGAVQCYGLGILLGDSRVVEMTNKLARIEVHDGARQSFTRRPPAGAVPVWTVQ